MSPSQAVNNPTSSPSVNVTAKLRSDGKNWKDWKKQVLNAATAMNAAGVLDGTVQRPQFNPSDAAWELHELYHPVITKRMTRDQIMEETKKVYEFNQYIRPLNDDKVKAREAAESEHRLWGIRDAQLQNLLMSSVDTTLSNTIHSHQSAYTMYKALKDLHNTSDHDNLRRSWGVFTDLRAEDCKSIQDYVGRFKDAHTDLSSAGVTFNYRKPGTAAATKESNEELQSTIFVHGLRRVVPEWCEQRENDLRQGNAWTLDKLVASLSDHLRHSNDSNDPVKSFTTIAKQQEEKRILSRIADRQRTSNNKPLQSSKSTTKTERQPTAWCDHCKKDHTGGSAKCWTVHPELRPEKHKKRDEERRKQSQDVTTEATSNVTIASIDSSSFLSFFSSIVSPSITTKAIANRQYQQRYLFDTGANSHVFNDRSKFITYSQVNRGDVSGATGSAAIAGRGTIAMKVVLQDGTISQIRLDNVLHCPEFATNVISQAPFKRKGAYYSSREDKLYTADGDEFAYLPEIDGIPNFLVINNDNEAPAALAYASLVAYRSSHCEPVTTHTATEWHHIFGHASYDIIARTAKVVKGMVITGSPDINCRPCGLAKSTQTISRRPQLRPQRLLGLVHIDLVGPIREPGKDGEKYFMIITDGRSRRRWAYTSDSKAVLGNELVSWAKKMKVHCNLSLIAIRCDNAAELLSTRNKTYFNEEGVTIEPSPPYEPTRNGIAERANAIVMNRVRAALIAADLPEHLWPYAVKYMVRLHNFSVTNGTNGDATPHEIWHSELQYPNPVPNVALTQAFGQPGYVHIPTAKRIKGQKFAPRAVRGHLVGMIGESIYQMWLPDEDKVITTSSVKFDKHGEKAPPPPDVEDSPPSSPMMPRFNELPDIASGTNEYDDLTGALRGLWDTAHNHDNVQVPNTPTATPQRTPPPIRPRAPSPEAPQRRRAESPPSPVQTTRHGNRAERRHEIDADLRQENIITGRRQRRKPEHFTGISFTMASCFATAILKPTVGSKLSELPPEPRNWKDFKNHPRRQQLQAAMDAEYVALTDNNTWRLATTDEINKYKPIPAQWVWAYKGNAEGYHVKDKARMVACGNRQDQSVWHEEVYSYVVRISTLRVLLALVAARDWECEQIDMITAYLNSQLADNDVVLLTLPPGCPAAKQTVRLLRGMYGLRQSALLWYNDLKASLKVLGFTPIEADQCVFVHERDSHIIVVYVDDLLLITNTKADMAALKDKLLRRYKSRDLGPVNFYLGIRIVRDRTSKTISLAIDGYFDRLAEEYHLADASPVYSPLPADAVKLTKRDDSDQADANKVQQFQSMVAKLLYPAQIVRPDIAWSVNFLARFSNNPTDEHISLLRRVIVYCKTTATLGIKYYLNADVHSNDNLGIAVYSDSAYADNPERKSSAGYVVLILGAPVSFKAYRQRIVTSSSTEAEFVALTYAAKEAAWIRRLLHQLGYRGVDLRPTVLYSDNLPAVHLVKNSGHHERTKHIDVAYKYVREEYNNNNVSISHIAGVNMPADGLTKPLDKIAHTRFVKLIGLIDVPRT